MSSTSYLDFTISEFWKSWLLIAKTAKCNDDIGITSFQAHDSFLCPLKTSESQQKFSNILKEFKKGILYFNGLIQKMLLNYTFVHARKKI